MCQNFFCSAEDLNKDEHSNFHSAEHKSKPECHKKPSYRGAFMFFLLVFLSLHPSSSLSSPCLLSSIFLCSLSLPSLLHTHSLTFLLSFLCLMQTPFFLTPFFHTLPFHVFSEMANMHTHWPNAKITDMYAGMRVNTDNTHTHTRTQRGVR